MNVYEMIHLNTEEKLLNFHKPLIKYRTEFVKKKVSTLKSVCWSYCREWITSLHSVH